MHHRVSGYNRVAMSQRRKDAAFTSNIVILCRRLIDSIIGDATNRWAKNGIDPKVMIHAKQDRQ